ncbi:hypothetical protein O6H91_03G135100 [Diphasiastrum complanatum]|uniref:Uncharacterized protein n=1 Tax=Diphasiastrum complanatum TaxID=34168 RepID=A0ACC2EC28_DIPCM|nr:hypothetical protein O6H91_03G135100 [Diphasiastrum complanatum]
MASRAASLLFPPPPPPPPPPPCLAQSFTAKYLHPPPRSDLCLHNSASHTHHLHLHLHLPSYLCLHHSASHPRHSLRIHPLNNNNQPCCNNSCQKHRSIPFIPPSCGAFACRGFRGTDSPTQACHRTEPFACNGTDLLNQTHNGRTDKVTQAYCGTDGRFVDEASGLVKLFQGFDGRIFTAVSRVCLTCVVASLVWSSPLPSLDLQGFWRFARDQVQMDNSAYATGLFQMPPFKLNNRYFLVRAGESQYESKGVINTNPVAKTSIDNGLSEKGKRQTLKAAIELKELGACEGSCWIWPSITQRAYQAAEAIAEINNITRSRIVPEYSFLDARGLGSYEGRDITALNEQVYNTDFQSPSLRPPPYTDGTPNESVADVFVRVTQLMSILETQYSGDNIIIVSPDSDNLSVLQAGLTGLDLRRHSNLAFAPGEVRLIDMSSVPSPRRPVSGLIECPKPPACR